MKNFVDDSSYLRIIIDRNLDTSKRNQDNYKRKQEQKLLEENNPIAKRCKRVQGIMQGFSHEEKRANQIKIEACKQMKLQLIEFFREEVGLVNNKRNTANYDKMQNIFSSNVVQNALKKLEIISEEIKSLKLGYYTDYESMFNTLIDDIDIKFALYAPSACLKRKSVKLEQLPNDLRVLMNRRIDELGLEEEIGFLNY